METNKKALIILCLVMAFPGICVPLSSKERKSPRETVSLNREWRYAQGDFLDAEKEDYDDRNWNMIGLPHSFSIPYFMSKDFYVGYGWYRKQLMFSCKDLDKALYLEFDGVFQEAEIFVNGLLVDKHFGGYTGFTVNISSAAREGNNMIAIRVNNLWRADEAPRAGEHVFSGGIYRNVRLVKKAPVFIDWCGTFVTTPDLAESKGQSSTVKIQTEINNLTDESDDYRLKTEIVNVAGKVVACVESAETIVANGKKIFEQVTPSVNNPVLWHPRNPVLYKVISTLYKGKIPVDCDETVLGFRWFNWTADQGFFLNGEHLYLKGANVHQDQAGWGDAVTEAAMRRDVRMMKEAGLNFIRGSHYPHAPAFSRACDEEGVLFWSEAPFWGIGGHKPDGYWNSSAYPVSESDRRGFEVSALRQLEEMVRIHRNHPSIIVWSMCNEPFFTDPKTMSGVRGLLKKMVNLCRELDPTRPAAVGGVQRPLGTGRIDMIGDVAGYNGDGGSIPEFQNPGIPSIVSEYGSTTADRPGEYMPGWGDLAKDNAYKGLVWRSGQAIWCGFDHGSIAGSQLGKMGIVDYFRLPKRIWYWYRNEYRNIAPPEWSYEGIPAEIKLEASSYQDIRTDGTDDVWLSITLLDEFGKEVGNSPSVELTVISGPGEFPTGRSIRFDEKSDIRIIDGKAAISFRSYYSGMAVIKATSPKLKPAEIKIVFVGGSNYIEGKTPIIVERPYERFVRVEESNLVQTFGPNNPTFATTTAIGHAAGLAADGDKNTWWQPDEKDPNPCWTVDTEKGLNLQDIKIRFPEAAIYQYKVEGSDDNVHWTMLLDRQDNVHAEDGCELNAKGKAQARFVRISFNRKGSGVVPQIAEIEIKGIVRD